MLRVLKEQIEEKLLNLHTAGLAKIVKLNGSKASIQPLAMVQSVSGKVDKQGVLEDVPILEHVVYVASQEGNESLAVGQVVMYMCCEREISQTKDGKLALPAKGHHELASAVIIGRLV